MVDLLRERLEKREPAIGAWIATGSPNVVDILRNLPFDWFVFDMEHSPIGIETVNHMAQVLNGSAITPVVRVGQIDQALMKLVLDSGARGIVVPLVNTPEEAERAVKFAKYPPAGIRGVAGAKASEYGLTLSTYIRNANVQTTLIAQIETPQAVENIKDIVAVKGVDVAFVGPSDLTMTLGLYDDRSNPRVAEAMQKVVRACTDAGKAAGVMTGNLDEVKLALERGFKFISLGSDSRHLMMGARSFLAGVGRS